MSRPDGKIVELERIAAEQSALRRVAELVARQASSEAVFALVTEELSGLLGVEVVRTLKFEPDGNATVVAARGRPDDRIPPGTTLPAAPGGMLDQLIRTGRPARLDDYSRIPGTTSALLRSEGMKCAAGGPIIVDGRLWGAMVATAATAESLPQGSEDRIARFAELVSAAISNIESHEKVEQLAAEQAALRRVAELVARQAPPDEVFALVTEELSRLLSINMVRTVRLEPNGTATVVATHGITDERLTRGSNFEIPQGSLIQKVARTGRPARLDDFDEVTGPIGAILREQGAGAGVGGPIVVDGRLWGTMAVFSQRALPAGAEDRVAQFSGLVSTAISNLESRSSVERLASEQAALRRVAELVAREVAPLEVFSAVTQELGHLMDVDIVKAVRFEQDGRATVLATWGLTDGRIPAGSHHRIPRGSLMDTVVRTGGMARVDEYDQCEGPVGAILRDEGARCGVAAPLIVDGRLWGAIAILSRTPNAFPPGAELRVTKFCELISTAISNLDSRAKVERLAAEQAALRRVATLVARQHSPDDLFAALIEEVRVLLGVDAAEIVRYEAGGTATMVAGWSNSSTTLPVGERLALEGENLASDVLRSGRAERKEDYQRARGPIAAMSRAVGIRSAVGCPILVDEVPWGMMAVASRRPEPLPPDTEERLAEFSHQAAMAVANAKSRAELAASRARIVRTGDEARRRFERDLHDGAQQRLVSMGFEIRAAEATVPPEFDDVHRVLERLDAGLNEVVDDLRELSQGIHPAVLSEGGLVQALRALARRSAVPIDLRLDIDSGRLEEPVEVTAYYLTSEALTNIAKHARASRVEIHARENGDWFELTVRDDGRGGADPSAGTGLTGLVDRVEAVGGTIHVDSPPAAGTTIHVKLPIHTATRPTETAS